MNIKQFSTILTDVIFGHWPSSSGFRDPGGAGEGFAGADDATWLTNRLRRGASPTLGDWLPRPVEGLQCREGRPSGLNHLLTMYSNTR